MHRGGTWLLSHPSLYYYSLCRSTPDFFLVSVINLAKSLASASVSSGVNHTLRYSLSPIRARLAHFWATSPEDLSGDILPKGWYPSMAG